MHDKIHELLIKYKNGQCTEEEEEMVKSHLKECDECKKKLMELQFDISYDSSGNEESVEVDTEKNDGYSVSGSKSDSADKGIELTNSYDENDNDNAKNKTPQGIDKVKALKVIVAIVVVVFGYFVINAGTLSGVCRKFMEVYDKSFIIPEECMYNVDEVSVVKLNVVKEEIREELASYYIYENEDFENMYSIVSASLSEQARGEYPYIKTTDEITSVSVNRIFLANAEVKVTFCGGEDKYSYKIKCVRDGFSWKIESCEFELGK